MSYFHAAALLAALLISATSSLQAATDTPGKDRPNVILFLADDFGAGDLASAGHPYVKSPNLDTFSQQSLTIYNAYSAGTWCAPSRYAMMRGQYPGRGFYSDLTLKPDEPSITSFVKSHGYRTAHIGKWHLKGEALEDYAIDFPYAVNGPNEVVTGPAKRSQEFRATSTEIFVDKAIEFIDAGEGEPFYINLWVQPTHSFINPLPGQLEAYADLEVKLEDFENPHQREYLAFIDSVGDLQSAMRAYCADVTELDKQFGRLMEHLEARGLAENTIVLFTSDNGPGPLHRQTTNPKQLLERYKERPELINMVGSAGIFRDRKSSIREGGIRVPYMIRFPERIPAGKVDTESIVCGVDWFTTLADYLGEPLPEGHAFDGQSLRKVYEGATSNATREMHWFETRGAIAVRKERYKILNYSGNYKEGFELYDLVNDPEESKDLRKTMPEVYQSMLKSLEKWRDQTVEAP